MNIQIKTGLVDVNEVSAATHQNCRFILKKYN